ncbi:MAG: acyl-CoA dehydrogenase [Acidimicrobiia bacterium]|nr:acyl-CoA dehydrogenase [Acidimicrobiia bacterium]
MSQETITRIQGGSFLIKEVSLEDVFTPEDFTEEHRMIAETAEQFVANEVVPRIEELEAKKEGLNEELLRKAAEIGLLGAGVPQAYGGEGLDQISSTILAEKTGRYGSFATTFGAHTGIGTLPIVYFGREQQKSKYLPKLASGEWIAAYALTEAESGSDALNARTKAALSPDGQHYLLNGTKMFITNAAFAHVFITFAKVDGEKFTAFVVERDFPGVSVGPEEHKMGIRGSSTRTLILENARVPAENVLGEVGNGHKIAFNVLNFGRFKLGASVVAGVRYVTNEAIRYAQGRRQFGKPIIEFGAIQHKLAEMAIQILCAESMVYRTVGLIDAAMCSIDKTSPQAAVETLKALEDYVVECSVIKVANSEILDFVVDEALQIYGGYGYSEDYPVERCYRDARINRIFEGTNEINRLLITGQLLKRAMKGQLGLIAASQRLLAESLSFPAPAEDNGSLLSVERRLVASAKKMFLLASGVAVQKYRDKMAEQQEVLSLLSDLVIGVYAMESLLLRVLKGVGRDGPARWGLQAKAAEVFIHSQLTALEDKTRQILAATSEGDELRTHLAALRRFAKAMPVDVIRRRQEIAQKLNEAGKYCLS